MFSGIIEVRSFIQDIRWRDQVLEVHLNRPQEFDDIKIGDSIAVNGTCLTVESFSNSSLIFVLGKETLEITTWKDVEDQFQRSEKLYVNMERSLKLSDRIHGHLVSGHVDTLAKVLEKKFVGENLLLKIELPQSLKPFVWKKSSITVNGVSLTINDLLEDAFTIGLIPETQKRTQLTFLEESDFVNLEADYLAKTIVHNINLNQKEEVSL